MAGVIRLRSILAWGLAASFAAAQVSFAAPPLGLDEALRIAERNSSQLAGQRAAVDAANALVGPASQNPDPKLTFGVENVPVSGAERWSLNADGMTMRRIGVMQDFMRGEKLDARGAKAKADAGREAAMLEAQKLDLRRDVALAWLERHYAARIRELVEAQIREADLLIQSSQSDVASGRALGAEVIAALSARATLADKVEDMKRMERRSTAMLARWLGDDADREPADAPDVTRLTHEQRAIEADIEGHPELAQYGPMIESAEAELRMAAAATKPDWSLELSYGVRGSAFPDMVSLMVRTELPLFASRRQDPTTEARRRQLDQARSQADEARRRHAAEIRATLADWESARTRVFRYRGDIIPLAEQRERAVAGAFEVGRATLPMVVEARRMVLETRMNALAVEAELARAWARLAFLVQEPSLR